MKYIFSVIILIPFFNVSIAQSEDFSVEPGKVTTIKAKDLLLSDNFYRDRLDQKTYYSSDLSKIKQDFNLKDKKCISSNLNKLKPEISKAAKDGYEFMEISTYTNMHNNQKLVTFIYIYRKTDGELETLFEEDYQRYEESLNGEDEDMAETPAPKRASYFQDLEVRFECKLDSDKNIHNQNRKDGKSIPLNQNIKNSLPSKKGSGV